MADLQRKHEVEVESLRSKQRLELQERRQEHEQQLQGVQKTMAAAQQELGTAKAAAARHSEDLVLQKKALQVGHLLSSTSRDTSSCQPSTIVPVFGCTDMVAGVTGTIHPG